MMMKGAMIGKQRTPSTMKFIVRMMLKTILCRVERRSQSYSVSEKSIIGNADEREVKTF